MKYIKFALLSIYDNVIMNLLMIIEIIVIILGTNIIVGAYNNRNMLIKPYENILDKTGWYMISDSNISTEELIIDDMQGDLHTLKTGNYFDKYGDIPIRIKIIPNEIISNMELPTKSGKWKTDSDHDGQLFCIAAPNIYGIKDGDVIKTSLAGEITVSALLTDPCYIPEYTSWNATGGIDNFYTDYSILYYNSEITNDELILIMSENEFGKTGLNINGYDFRLIIYDSNPTAENTAHNEMIIKENYQCGISLNEIKNRAELSINNLMKKYLPIAICAFIVIVLGFISCTAVNTMKQMKNYGTLFTCGMNWNNCIKICSAYTFIILVCSLSISISIFSVINNFNISAVLGLTYETNNLFITLSVISLIFLLNLMIPVLIIKRKTPVDILREGKV